MPSSAWRSCHQRAKSPEPGVVTFPKVPMLAGSSAAGVGFPWRDMAVQSRWTAFSVVWLLSKGPLQGRQV